jgi:hypothetical protein
MTATGNGTLTIDTGAQAFMRDLRIAQTTGSNGTVMVKDPVTAPTIPDNSSALVVARNVVVGAPGTGNLELLDHASAEVGEQLQVGVHDAGSGTVTIDDRSLVTVHDAARIGGKGTGVVTIKGAGHLESKYGVVLENGTVKVNGAGSL